MRNRKKWKQFNCSIFKKIDQKLNWLNGVLFGKYIFKEVIMHTYLPLKLCIYKYRIRMSLGCKWWNENNLYHGHNDDDVDYHEKYLGERRVGFGWVDVLGCPDKKGVFNYRGRQHKRYVVPLPLYSLGFILWHSSEGLRQKEKGRA